MLTGLAEVGLTVAPGVRLQLALGIVVLQVTVTS
jgi:hypothetical protein